LIAGYGLGDGSGLFGGRSREVARSTRPRAACIAFAVGDAGWFTFDERSQVAGGCAVEDRLHGRDDLGG